MNGKNGNRDAVYYANTSLASDTLYQMVRIPLSNLDNNPPRFWKTLLDGLSSWNLLFIQAERQTGFPTSDALVRRFLQTLADEAHDSPLVLEINNQHRIHNRQVQEFLRELVALRVPGVLVLLLSIRCEEDEADELIREYKYRYVSEAEERLYYADAGVDLTDEQAAMIRSFTDGWAPAAVFFLPHLLREGPVEIFQDFDNYIENWICRRHTEQYNDRERRLFVFLNIFGDFPLELFERLSGWGSEETLHVFERTPFLRYDAKSSRFSICRHMRRYLLRMQHLLDKKEQQQLMIQAGDWFRQQGHKADAIDCYRRAGSNSKIRQVLQQWDFPPSQESATCYVETINALPAGFVDSHPLLYVMRAHSLCTLYRYTEATALMEEFCIRFDQGEQTPEAIRPALGEAYALWAYCAMVQNDAKRFVERLRKAAPLLPNGSSLVQSRVNRQADTPALMLPSPEPGSVPKALGYMRELDARLDMHMGKNGMGGGIGTSLLFEAEMHFYTRNFKAVENLAYRAANKALGWEQYDNACSAYFLLMRYNMAKGNYERLVDSLEYLQATARKAQYDTFFTMPDLAESWLALKLGRKHEVADWIIDNAKHRERIKPWNFGRDHVIRCLYLLQNQSYGDIISYTGPVIDLDEKRGLKPLVLHLQLMRAIAHSHLGESAEAAYLFEEVYRWIHGNHLIMLVIEYGAQTVHLVGAYRATGRDGIPEDWLSMAEKKAKSYQSYVYTVRNKFQQRESSKASVLESLSGMEQKMLLMLTNGMTIREIAREQGRTEGAVRTMLHKVYGKIGANGKLDAVRIATACHIDQFVKL